VINLGLTPEGNWPPPLQHELVDINIVNLLVKGGALPKEQGDQLTVLYDAYLSCVNTLWKKGKEEEQTVQASDRTSDAKYGKLEAVAKTYENKAKKECAPAAAKYETGLVTLIEQRNKQRMAMFGAVKGRTESAIKK
jgi:hypothetical protein